MKGKILTIALVTVVLGLLVAACAPAPTPTPTPKPAAPTPTPAPKVIKVGYISPLTGPAAEFGTNGTRGIEIALDEINEKGIQIKGETYKIEIIPYDSVCEPTEAVANVRRLCLEDKVVAYLGDHCSSCCCAIAPLSDEYKVPGITIECAATAVTKPGHEYYFRMRPDMALMVPEVAPRVAEILKPEKVAFLGVNDDYGRSWVESFKKCWEELGIETVAEEFFERGTTDYTTYLQAIKRANPDLVGFVGVTPEGKMILEQATELGLRPEIDFFGAEEFSTYELLKLAGAETLEGMYAVGLWGEAPDFLIKEVKERYGAPMHYAIIFGYDALHVLADAIERAQSLDPTEIRDALEAGTYETIEGFTEFKDFEGYTNQGKYTPYLIQWRNGERTVVK